MRSRTDSSGAKCSGTWCNRLLVLAAPLLLTLVVAACDPSTEPPQRTPESSTANGISNQIRHDLEPLTKRFPTIGNPVSATWMSGTLGAQSDSRPTVPGPSVYWIEAIIELEPATADTLRSKYAPTNTGQVPNLNESLRTEVPAGPYLTSTAMDTALSNNDWRSTSYLHSGSTTLVMRSIDD